jgi:Domain of unknown function (DUF5753)
LFEEPCELVDAVALRSPASDQAATMCGLREDIDQAVAVRMQRQQVLYDPAKRFHFILSEAVLHSRLCPDQVFAGQLDRLIALSSLENVRLGILPFSVMLPFAPLNGFWIFDDGLVTFETIGAELHIRDPEEIALYVGAFE